MCVALVSVHAGKFCSYVKFIRCQIWKSSWWNALWFCRNFLSLGPNTYRPYSHGCYVKGLAIAFIWCRIQLCYGVCSVAGSNSNFSILNINTNGIMCWMRFLRVSKIVSFHSAVQKSFVPFTQWIYEICMPYWHVWTSQELCIFKRMFAYMRGCGEHGLLTYLYHLVSYQT